MASPHPPFPRRVVLKIKRIARELAESRADREWRLAWPLIDSVPGWLADGQERWLFEAAYSLPDLANVVEIGSFKGRSTCSLAFGCRGSKKRVFAIDTFNGNEWDFADRDFLGQFSQNIKRCGLSEYVEPVVGVSSEVAKTWNRPIHFLFIDGSHRYEDVLADFTGFFPHVVPGGTVALHDVNDVNGDWPGVFKVWHGTVKSQLSDIDYCKNLAFGRKPIVTVRDCP